MTSENQSFLILGMEKRLGRALTGDERRLILLAEELIESEQKEAPEQAKGVSNGAE